MIGWDVSVLQFLLRQRGLYDGPSDGYFGPATRKALRRYQSGMQLAADGIAGKATTAALVLQLHVPVAPKPAAKLQPVRYVVRSGDSLTAIAERYRVSVGSLAKLNRLDPSRVLLIGTKLKVPTGKGTTSPAAAAAKAMSVRDALGVWSARYGVSPSLARALSWMESGFQEDVRSSVGAWGPMQLLPVTWDFVETVLLKKQVPKTAEGNVQVGVAYLKHLLGRFDGNQQLALAAWYQGERAVRERGVYAETKQFVANVLALEQRM